MSEIQVSKSILAKLLAAENITVSHQATKTAYFDLKSRTLVCPVWKDMDGDLYDLLMGHEVGHALETPAQGWHDAVADKEGKKVDVKFKSFLNVIEDARIEKKIKRRYPGLSKSFAAAYKGLYDRNFFGVKNIDPNKLSLIDRINIRFKVGAHVAVPFSDTEREFVREVEQAETWEQVEDIARRAYDYVKQNEQDKLQNLDDLKQEEDQQKQEEEDQPQDDGEQQEFDSEDFNDDEPSDDSDDSSDYFDDLSDSEDSTEPEEAAEEDAEMLGDGHLPNDDEPESITDRVFRQREDELVNKTGKIYSFELPVAKLENIILKNNIVMDDLESFVRQQVRSVGTIYGRNGVSYDTVVQKCVRKFNNNNKKYIMHILKEFDMRKKATQYARTQTARTGELNMNVLHNYKFSNDIFKKIAVVPKGKNHGMMLYLDMSGSMTNIFRNTIEQLLVLVSFCKMANIPFEVYGFSDAVYASRKPNDDMWEQNVKTSAYLNNNKFHLKHLIGSSLPQNDYRRSFNMLCVVANEFARYHSYYGASSTEDSGQFDGDWRPAGFNMNGTPFVETLLASREMITKFRSNHKLDITNVIYLTDGEGGPSLQAQMEGNSYYNSDNVFYFVDKKTKKKIRCDGYTNQQAAITELVRQVTGCKHIGFFLAPVHEFRGVLNEIRWKSYNGMNTYKEEDIDAMRKSLKENKFFSCANLGYDNYFYMASSDENVKEEKLDITSDMTKSKMATAFKKMQISKRSSRVLISKFTEEIAVAI